MKVLIIGAGPGGLALGIALQNQNIDFQIFERRTKEEIAAQKFSGYDLSPSGVRALHRIGGGAYEAVKAQTVQPPTKRFVVQSNTGSQISAIDISKVKEYKGYPLLTVRRAKLLLALISCVEESKITWGCSVTKMEQGNKDNQASVTLNDGKVIYGDVLIGADGLHSKTRKAMFGDCGIQSRGDLGVWAMMDLDGDIKKVVDEASDDEKRMDDALMLLGDGKMWMFSVGTDHAMWFMGRRLAKPYISVPPAPQGGWKADVEKHVKDVKDLPLLAKLIHATQPSDIVMTMCCDRDPLDEYATQRCALIGDAAHPFTPYMGQGASQAFVDAFCVSRVLAECQETQKNGEDDNETESFDSIQKALKKYESMRLKPSSDLMLESRQTGDYMMSSTKAWLSSAAMKLMPDSFVTKFFYAGEASCHPDALLPPSQTELNNLTAI